MTFNLSNRVTSFLVILFVQSGPSVYAGVNQPRSEQSMPRGTVLNAIDTVFIRHKVNEIGKYFSSNYIQHQSGIPNGSRPLEIFLKDLFLGFPDYSGQLEQVISEGDKVFVLMTWHGTHKGTFQRKVPTGKVVTRTTADVFRVEKEKIVEHWGVVDQLQMLQALGILHHD